MVHKTVLKVDISCKKCKKKVLKAVSSLRGIDKIEIDGAKGTLSITGDADPFDVIARCRKAGRFADIVSIGPPPKPQDQQQNKKQDEKKPEEKKPAQAQAQPQPQPQMIAHYPCPCPLCYNNNNHMPMPGYAHFTRLEEPQPFCTIL